MDIIQCGVSCGLLIKYPIGNGRMHEKMKTLTTDEDSIAATAQIHSSSPFPTNSHEAAEHMRRLAAASGASAATFVYSNLSGHTPLLHMAAESITPRNFANCSRKEAPKKSVSP